MFHHNPLICNIFYLMLPAKILNFWMQKTYRSSEHPIGGIMLILMKLLLSFWVVVLGLSSSLSQAQGPILL